MKLEIRRAHPDEADRLTEIALASKRHWQYPESYIELWRNELTFIPDYILRHHVYVAEANGALIGLYALVDRGETVELEHLWILPAQMRQGVGTAMLEHAIAIARNLGWPVITLVSDPNAEGFYLKCGARRTGMAPSTPEGRILPILDLPTHAKGSP